MQRAPRVCRLHFTSDVVSGDVSGSATVFSLCRQRDSLSRLSAPGATAANRSRSAAASGTWSTVLVDRNLERLYCLLG